MTGKLKNPGHKPVIGETRICFGIDWYATEKEADEMGEYNQKSGCVYWGGFFHGMPCGRDKTWDIPEGKSWKRYDRGELVKEIPGPLYAATR